MKNLKNEYPKNWDARSHKKSNVNKEVRNMLSNHLYRLKEQDIADDSWTLKDVEIFLNKNLIGW